MCGGATCLPREHSLALRAQETRSGAQQWSSGQWFPCPCTRRPSASRCHQPVSCCIYWDLVRAEGSICLLFKKQHLFVFVLWAVDLYGSNQTESTVYSRQKFYLCTKECTECLPAWILKGKRQFMACICFCHYVWLVHFIVELIILIIAFPCTYKHVIGAFL